MKLTLRPPYVYDIKGKKYLDTFAILVTSICGHDRPEVRKAVYEQMKKLEFFPNYVDSFTLPLIKLAKKLEEIPPIELISSLPCCTFTNDFLFQK